jgi:hypothetical protein
MGANLWPLCALIWQEMRGMEFALFRIDLIKKAGNGSKPGIAWKEGKSHAVN